MAHSHADVRILQCNGVTACKKIFPALQAMVKRGYLDVPALGFPKWDWNLDQLRCAGV